MCLLGGPGSDSLSVPTHPRPAPLRANPLPSSVPAWRGRHVALALAPAPDLGSLEASRMALKSMSAQNNVRSSLHNAGDPSATRTHSSNKHLVSTESMPPFP